MVPDSVPGNMQKRVVFMDRLSLIGMREAIIIYLIVLVLFLVSMFSAQPRDKTRNTSPGSLIMFIIVSAVFVTYILSSLLNII